MVNEHVTNVPTPFGDRVVKAFLPSGENHDSTEKSRICLFPTCMSSEAASLKNIFMRQSVQAKKADDDSEAQSLFVVFNAMACGFHSELSRARKAKKKMSLTQRTRLRYILDTLDYLVGSFTQLPLNQYSARLESC